MQLMLLVVVSIFPFYHKSRISLIRLFLLFTYEHKSPQEDNETPEGMGLELIHMTELIQPPISRA